MDNVQEYNICIKQVVLSVFSWLLAVFQPAYPMDTVGWFPKGKAVTV
jgi:hypothetical protein